MLYDNVINHFNIELDSLRNKPLCIQRTIKTLINSFDSALNGKLSGLTYLSSMDCGTGKTSTLSRYLYYYKKAGFIPSVGVLIVVRNLEDVNQIIKTSGLEKDDFAIFTPDDRFKHEGLGEETGKANILFITQAMLKKRLPKKGFATADEFFFRGRPRALRVCDEGILPAGPISINSDRLLALVEDWIVVCPLDNTLTGAIIQPELKALLHQPDNVAFVTWGRHVGTNAVKDTRNVVVIGAFRQPESVYQARYMAASGKPIESFTGDEWKEVWAEEIEEALMQAISRGNVRNARRGVCGECTVHIVVSSNPDPIAMLADAFPGASVRPWYPEPPTLTGQALTLIEKVEELQGEGYLFFAKARLAERIEVSASRLGQLLARSDVQVHLQALGVTMSNKMLDLRPPTALAA